LWNFTFENGEDNFKTFCVDQDDLKPAWSFRSSRTAAIGAAKGKATKAATGHRSHRVHRCAS